MSTTDTTTTLLIIPRDRRGEAHQVRVTIEAFRGDLALHARWYRRGQVSAAWVPTAAGVTFRPCDLAQLEAAVVAARRLVEGGGR